MAGVGATGLAAWCNCAPSCTSLRWLSTTGPRARYRTVTSPLRCAGRPVACTRVTALGVAPTGRKILVAGSSHYVLRSGRIVRDQTVFDELAVLRQVHGGLGAKTPEGSL